MENVTTLYCELMTPEEVAEFESVMAKMGYDEFNRPAKLAERVPYWMRAGKPRGENDDPLAAIILNLYHSSAQYLLYAAYRCTDGEQITPAVMQNFILALNYTPLPKL